ncbi:MULTISPECIES: hypothetical protein [unclassified Caballeronia]|nr:MULTISPECIES: hypothetical protein [unclassified Caballeronia]
MEPLTGFILDVVFALLVAAIAKKKGSVAGLPLHGSTSAKRA